MANQNVNQYGYIPLTDEEIAGYEKQDNIDTTVLVRIRTKIGGAVWVAEKAFPETAAAYRSGKLDGREPLGVESGVIWRVWPREPLPVEQTSLPPINTLPPTQKIKTRVKFPINVKINPAVTSVQEFTLNYPFELRTELIDVNISEPLISASLVFLNEAIENYVDEERELKTLLNYGEDRQTVVLAYRYGQPDNDTVNTIQLKLLQPIPEEVQLQSPVFLSREVAKTLIDKIRTRFATPLDTTPYLRPKNLGATADLDLGKSLNNVTLKVLSLQTGSVGSDDPYKNITFEDQIFRKWYSYDFESAELNLDFTDYNKFIFYGSAGMRLQSFRQKLILLDGIEFNRQQFLSSSVYSMQTSSAAAVFIQDRSAQYAKEKEDIIRSFDRYEQHLYFTSGTISPYTASAWYYNDGVEFNSSSYWPKIGNTLAPVDSVEAEEWFSTQLEIAQRYDEFNENNLVNTIPTHVREHEDNAPYITFVTMIGHFFDIMKPYVDQFPYIYDRGLNPNTGLSKDLINEIAEAVGFTMPTVNSIYNLADNILGTDDQEPRRDLTAETYKRLLHNLPFFVKSKGARTSLLTLIKTLGFSNSLVSVRETGVASSGSFYSFDEYSNGLKFTALTATSASIVTASLIPLLAENDNPIITEEGDVISLEEVQAAVSGSTSPSVTIPFLGSPKTLQLNLSLDTTKTTAIVNSDIGWELLAVPHPTIPNIAKIALIDESGTVVLSTKYEEVLNGELFSIAIRSTPEESSLRVIKTEENDILFDSVASESVSFNTTWQNTGYVYIGGAGAFYASSSFVGIIDEVRLWSEPVSDEMILNTTFDPGSNAGDTYTSAVDDLLVQLSFNKFDADLLMASSSVRNEAPVPPVGLQYFGVQNITTGSLTRFYRTIRQLVTSIGTTSYVSNKIKLLDYPSTIADKNGVKRLHKSKTIYDLQAKRTSRGRNKIVLANSPTEIVNQNIIRNFGIENVNTALGVPTTLYKNFQRSLEKLRRYYNQYYYVDVDANQFIRVLSEVSSVLDQVVDYFIPSRATVLKGIIIEQSILEQTRVPLVKDARLYGNNSRRTLRAPGSLTGSAPDYSATYTTDGVIEPKPETFGTYKAFDTEIERTVSLTGTKSLITSSIYMTENVLTGDIKEIKGDVDVEEAVILTSKYTPIKTSISLELDKVNKIPYNDNNHGSVGAEPFDRIYPRKLLGMEIEKDRHGGTRSIYLPAIYDIPPIADFRDFGVRTFFNHPDGVYKFPIIKKKLAYIRPLNQPWNYQEQQFEGITTWSFGSSYRLYDVVIQSVTVKDSGSLGFDTINAARGGNNKYYAFTTRPSYVPPENDVRYYSGSVPSFLPPSLDKDNWELIRFTPEVEYKPYRVVFDTFTIPDPVLTNYKLTNVELDSAIDFPNRFVDNYNVENVSGNGAVKGNFIIQNIAALFAIQANTSDVRIRLYRTAEARDADVNRPINQPPDINDGVLIDASIDVPGVAQLVNPIITLLSDSSPLEGRLYYTINNLTPVEKIGFVLSVYYFAIQINRRVPWGYLRKHYRYFRDNSTSTKRRNYVGCKNTINTTIDGLPPVQVFLSEGTDLVVSQTQTNQEIITGGGGQLNVT